MPDATLDDVHPVLAAWVRQLLSPEVASLVHATEGQIEVRLFANGARVRKNPMILLNAGPSPMADAG